VSENFGASALADRFGVTRYPAIFVDDVLVARPRDFGFFAEGEKSGRYTPWVNAESQARFRKDLARMVDLALAGRQDELARERREPAGVEAPPVAALPRLTLTDLAGKPLAIESAKGRVTVVEFWATWCPPCRGALAWLGELKKRYGDRLAVVAIALESDEAGVRKLEQVIGTVCRKQARRVVEGKTEKLVVNRDVLKEFLGGIQVRVETEVAERVKRPGVAVGLATSSSSRRTR